MCRKNLDMVLVCREKEKVAERWSRVLDQMNYRVLDQMNHRVLATNSLILTASTWLLKLMIKKQRAGCFQKLESNIS